MDLSNIYSHKVNSFRLSKSISFYRKALLLAFLLSALINGNAFSQLVVTNTNSSGAGSLSLAIFNATPMETITFEASLNGGTISGLGITIAKTLTIDASNLANGITLVGFGNSPVFTINSGTVILRNLIITNPTIDDNFTIGGIANYGTLIIEDTYFVNIGNFDGPTITAGVYNEDGASVTIRNSTFGAITGASAITNEGSMNLSNVTFSDVDTDDGGGGLYIINNSSTGTTVANHITVYSNNGAGIRNFATASGFELNHSLIDENFDFGGEALLYGSFFGDNNVLGDNNFVGVTGSGNFIATNGNDDMFILPLADNGGPVPTNAISASSPAVNRATLSSETLDARGKFANGVRDAGAYEFNGLDPIASLSQLTQGISPSPLPAGVNDIAVLGFSLTSNVTQTLTALSFSTTSESDDKLINWKLFTSTDNDFSTAGNNTEVTGITIATPNATTLSITGLNEALTTTPKNYFLVAEVNGTVSNTTPNIQLALTHTGVNVNVGIVNSAVVTGTSYSFTRPFITTWQTTTGGETITIPTTSGEVYNYTVYWGDGSVETIATDTPPSHSYAVAGTHTVSISGDFPRIFFANTGDITKIQSIEQWGEIVWVNMRQAFQGCANMVYNATDAPDLSNVTDMTAMFSGCTSITTPDLSGWDVSGIQGMASVFFGATNFNGNISTWITSSVDRMNYMFAGAIAFNQNLSTWDVSQVELMNNTFEGATAFNNGETPGSSTAPLSWTTTVLENTQATFRNAPSFNQNINSWNVSAVTDMFRMFEGAATFNQPLDTWDVSLVTSMGSMFKDAVVFDQPLNSATWNTANVENFGEMFFGAVSFDQPLDNNWSLASATNLVQMFAFATSFNQPLDQWGATKPNGVPMVLLFEGATSFNQPLSSWDVSGVNNMFGIFKNATAFDQNLSNWNISAVTIADASMEEMLDNTALTTANYDATLLGWSAQAVQSNLTFGAAGLTYCDPTGRNELTGVSNNWTINGDTPLVNPAAVPLASETAICSGASFNFNVGTDVQTGYTYMLYSEFIDLTTRGTEIGTWIEGNAATPVTLTEGVNGIAFGDNTFTVVGEDAGQTCESILNITLTIAVDPLPTVSISGDATICEGASTDLEFTLTGTGPYDVTYNAGAGDVVLTGISDGNTESVTPTTTTTYTLVNVTDANGCTAVVTGSATITVNSSPTVAIAGDATICEGATSDLTFTLTGTGPYDVTYNDGVADVVLTGISDGHIETVSPTNTTTYTLISVEDANLCSGTSVTGAATVTVNPLPTAAIAGDATICEGATSDLTFNLTGTGPFDVTYNDGVTAIVLTAIDNGFIETVSPTATTTYEIVSVTDANLCSASSVNSSTIVTVNPLPVISINAQGPFCSIDNAVDLVATPTGGTWSGTGITNANNGTFDPSITGAGTYTITYEVTENGCTDQANIDITVVDTPDASMAAAGPFCSDDAALNLTSINTGGTWSGVGITDAAIGTFDPSVAGVGSHVITYEINTGSCSDQQQITIIVNQTPAVTLNAQGPFCTLDAAATLTATPSGGVWSGTGITDINAGTFDPSVAGTGTFNITYTVTEAGCTAAESVDITVVDTPDATINAAGPFCSADAAVTLTAVNTGGIWSGSGITDADAGIFDPALVSPGSITITYTLEIGGCTDTKDITIIVNEGPQVEINEVEAICISAAPITLTATPAGGQWSGLGITDANSGTFDPTIAGAGVTLISYTLSIDGCSGSSEVNVEVLDIPANAGPIGGPNNLCAGEEAVFTTSAIAGVTTYEWETPSGPIATSEPELRYSPSESGQVSVVGVNSCGTGASTNITYTLLEAVVGGFNYSISPLNDLTYEFTNTSTGEVNSWLWDFGDGSTSTNQNPSHTYEQPGIYSVSLTSSNGSCDDVIVQTIDLDIEIIINIANVITANGNGQNDFIYIENIEKYPDHEVQLLNRWGKKVFSSTAFSNNPAEVSGKPDLEPGNYVCLAIIRFAGKEVKQQQLITVIK